METAVSPSPPPPARALGARAENPWGWAAPLADDDGGGRGGGGGEGDLLGATGATPPSRDRSWTVPSPYQPLDVKFSSTRCVPNFCLDDGVGGGGGAAVTGPGVVGDPEEQVPMELAATAAAVEAATTTGITAANDAAADIFEEEESGASIADDESCVPKAAAQVVRPAATATAVTAAAFASPLQDHMGGSGGHGADLRQGGLESSVASVGSGGSGGGSVGRISPEQAEVRSSEGEGDRLPSDHDDDDDDDGARETLDALGETSLGFSETVGSPSISSSPPPTTHGRGYTQEEIELAAAIAQVNLEDDGEARVGAGAFQGGGAVGGGAEGGGQHAEEEGEEAAAGAEKERRAAALMGLERFDLRFDDGEAVDEWDDDHDPGYMVMAVSEQELRGQVRPPGRRMLCFV